MPGPAPPRWRRTRRALVALVLVLGLAWLLRDALAARLVRSALVSRAEAAGYVLELDDVDVSVAAGLATAEMRLRGLRLRATATGSPLPRVELDKVRGPLPMRALFGGERAPGPWEVDGARVTLQPSADPGFAWPEVLPVAAVRGLHVRLPLVEGSEMLLSDATLVVRERPVASDNQPLELTGALAWQSGHDTEELGRLQAGFGWRAGRLTAGEGVELLLSESESLVLLQGSRLDLAPGDGLLSAELNGEALGGSLHVAGRVAENGRIVGEVRASELRLDRLAVLCGVAGLQPAVLTASATLDLPSDLAGLRELLAGARAELQAELRRPGSEDQVLLAGRLAGGVLELSQGSARTRGGSLQLATGRLELGDDWLDTRLALAGRADVADLQPLGELVAPLLASLPGDLLATGAWGGSLAGQVQAAGTARDPSLRLDLAGERVIVAGWHVGDLVLAATGDRRQVRVERCELRSPGGQLDVCGTLDVEARALLDVLAELRLDARGLAEGPAHDVLAALGRPWLPGEAGDVALQLVASGPLDAPRLQLTATLQDALVSAVAVVRAPPWAREAGAATEVQVEALSLGRAELELQLQQPAVLSLGECPQLTPLLLSGSAGSARLAFSHEAAGDRRRHEVLAGASGLRPALLPASVRPPGLLADELELDLRLAWTSAAPPGAARCDPTADAQDLELHLDLQLAQPMLDGRSLLGTRRLLRADLAGDPSAPRGRIEVDADDLQLALPASLAAALDALESGGEVLVDRMDVGEGGLLVDASGRVQEPAPAEPREGPRRLGPCALALRLSCGQTLQLEALRLTGAGALSVEASGRLQAPLDLRGAVAGLPALRGDAPLQLEARLAAVDVAHARAWLGDVRRLSGRLEADVQVGGTLAAPHVTGRAQLHEGELRLASGIPPVEALSAELLLDEREARIVRCTGELGAMPFELSGRVLRDGSDEAVDLKLRGEDLLVWRGQGVKVRADVDLSLTGPLEAPLVRGWLRLRDSRIVRAVDTLQLARVVPIEPEGGAPLSLKDSPLGRLRLDVAISATEPVRIENNIVRGAVLPDLRITGTAEEPVPEGELQIVSTRIALPASILDIAQGRLLFDADEPRRPSIDLQGTTRVRGHDLSVGVTGPYDEPVLELSSSPPLPSEEVLLLLLTGQPPSGNGPAEVGAGGTTTVYMGQDLLARWLTDTAGDEQGVLDRFEFGYAEDVTTRGSTLVQVSYHMVGDMQAGRPALYLHAEKDPYDAVNFGLRWRMKLR